jgi:hypothetical protein
MKELGVLKLKLNDVSRGEEEEEKNLISLFCRFLCGRHYSPRSQRQICIARKC